MKPSIVRTCHNSQESIICKKNDLPEESLKKIIPEPDSLLNFVESQINLRGQPYSRELEGENDALTKENRWLTAPGYSLVVQASINAIPIEAVVDCGAQVTVLQRAWLDKWLPNSLLSDTVRLKGASATGYMMASILYDANIMLKGHKVVIPIYVADISDDCILGLDWMRAVKVVIDFENGLLSINTQQIIAQYKQGRAGLVPLAEARATRKVIMKPNAAHCITIKTSFSNGETWMLKECISTAGVLAPNIIVCSAPVSKIWLMNVTDHHVTLKNQSLIGILQPVCVLNAVEIDEKEVSKIRNIGQDIEISPWKVGKTTALQEK